MLEDVDDTGYDEVSLDIERVQNDLCALGIPTLALQFMTAHEEELVQESLRLLVALLDGGNRAAQHGLLTILHKSKDGRVFLRLREKMVRIRNHQARPLSALGLTQDHALGGRTRTQEDSVDDIKEVRSILASIKRDQEKHDKVRD